MSAAEGTGARDHGPMNLLILWGAVMVAFNEACAGEIHIGVMCAFRMSRADLFKWEDDDDIEDGDEADALRSALTAFCDARDASGWQP